MAAEALTRTLHTAATARWGPCVLQELEAFYAQVHAAEGRDVKPHLPPSYPTSVRLGCVDVVDCLPVSCHARALPTSATAHRCKGDSKLNAWRQPFILDLFRESYDAGMAGTSVRKRTPLCAITIVHQDAYVCAGRGDGLLGGAS